MSSIRINNTQEPQQTQFLDIVSKNKKPLSTGFTALLFVACAIFVAVRGYKCFEKYLAKPEVVSTAFRFNGKAFFPSFTFCAKKDPEPYKKAVLEKCNLSLTDYTKSPKWTGNCTQTSPPKSLYEAATAKVEDFGIENMEIKAFDATVHSIQTANENLTWTKASKRLHLLKKLAESCFLNFSFRKESGIPFS